MKFICKRWAVTTGLVLTMLPFLALAESPPEQPSNAYLMTEEAKGIPLQSVIQSEKSSQHSPLTGDELARLTFSFLGVVLLLVGTLKVGLPKLLKRYPGAAGVLQKSSSATGLGPLFSPELFGKISTEEGKPLPRFTLHTSLPLGAGRSLYLVEVEGRKLVVGATPQQITFLAEFQDKPDPSA